MDYREEGKDKLREWRKTPEGVPKSTYRGPGVMVRFCSETRFKSSDERLEKLWSTDML